jgi:hypothetical protein
MQNHDHHSAAKVSRNRIGFKLHAAAFVLVNAMLAAINYATSPATLWFVYPLAGWGLGILLHAGLLRRRANGGRRLFVSEARKLRVEARREGRKMRREARREARHIRRSLRVGV